MIIPSISVLVVTVVATAAAAALDWYLWRVTYSSKAQELDSSGFKHAA
jgi:hypothetical protein